MIYPNLRHLHIFVETARRASFRGAADTLHVGQPAVSQAISQLESQVGVRLLSRTTRSVELTEAGTAFLTGAERILADVAEALASSRERTALGRSRVRISSVSSAAFRLLPQLMAQVQQAYPQVRIVLRDDSTRGIEQGVERGTDDLGLASEEIDTRRCRFVPLIHDEYRVVCRVDHPLAARDTVPAAELARHDLLMMDRASGLRRRFDRALERRGRNPTIRFETAQLYTLIGFVEAGFGVTAVPALGCPVQLGPTLVARPLVRPRIVRILGLVLPRGREPTAAARIVEDVMRQLCADRRLTLPEGARVL